MLQMALKSRRKAEKCPLKKLQQESDNVTKPEWIRVHYFGALSLLLQSGGSLFAVPVTLEIQDGVEKGDENSPRLVDKMSSLCRDYIQVGSYVILDAYFASKDLIQEFRVHSLHVIRELQKIKYPKNPHP
ncbi:hypothetical protein [Oscillatoria sp. HE19RPO]|uniref:hypothetical protein n=1 Tax=Oscillatoria sp. HE19RPO TaxID=2954806 RepID=UPI0020C27CAA|nr:hypothetical protein [Oscillatoria sp. HE19RPO]